MCSASFSLEIAAQRFVSVTRTHPMLAATRALEIGDTACHFTICESRCDWTSLQYQDFALEIGLLPIVSKQRGFRDLGIAYTSHYSALHGREYLYLY